MQGPCEIHAGSKFESYLTCGAAVGELTLETSSLLEYISSKACPWGAGRSPMPGGVRHAHGELAGCPCLKLGVLWCASMVRLCGAPL